MALYRIHKPMDKPGLVVGGIDSLAWLRPEQIAILVEREIVSRVATLPLVEIPGWKTRANKLVAVNIGDAEQFIEADVKIIKKALKARPETIQKWKKELLDQWLVISKKRK